MDARPPLLTLLPAVIYLAEKFPACGLLPSYPVARATVLSWLMWQMGSAPLLGRGFGQFYHCAR